MLKSLIVVVLSCIAAALWLVGLFHKTGTRQTGDSSGDFGDWS